VLTMVARYGHKFVEYLCLLRLARNPVALAPNPPSKI
jgi:hypothetical protein